MTTRESGQDWLENDDKTSTETTPQKISSARNNGSFTKRSDHGQPEKTHDGTQCEGRHLLRENRET